MNFQLFLILVAAIMAIATVALESLPPNGGPLTVTLCKHAGNKDCGTRTNLLWNASISLPI